MRNFKFTFKLSLQKIVLPFQDHLTVFTAVKRLLGPQTFVPRIIFSSSVSIKLINKSNETGLGGAGVSSNSVSWSTTALGFVRGRRAYFMEWPNNIAIGRKIRQQGLKLNYSEIVICICDLGWQRRSLRLARRTAVGAAAGTLPWQRSIANLTDVDHYFLSRWNLAHCYYFSLWKWRGNHISSSDYADCLKLFPYLTLLSKLWFATFVSGSWDSTHLPVSK